MRSRTKDAQTAPLKLVYTNTDFASSIFHALLHCVYTQVHLHTSDTQFICTTNKIEEIFSLCTDTLALLYRKLMIWTLITAYSEGGQSMRRY